MISSEMAGLLPAGMRCSAYWYAQARGLPLDLPYLKALGLTAWRIAAWEGLAEWQVPEGPYRVHMWPEPVWDAAANGVAWHQYQHAPGDPYEEQRDAGWGPGQVPWDGDDIR